MQASLGVAQLSAELVRTCNCVAAVAALRLAYCVATVAPLFKLQSCLHCSNLTSDLQHLRQLLHEEKEAAATANSLLDSSQPHLLPGTHIPLETATKEQVLQQLTIVLGKHATERARNGELVRRLQQLHAEKVDVIELQRQYLELQEAHFQQVRLALVSWCLTSVSTGCIDYSLLHGSRCCSSL